MICCIASALQHISSPHCHGTFTLIDTSYVARRQYAGLLPVAEAEPHISELQKAYHFRWRYI
jgi:hypothetical protein